MINILVVCLGNICRSPLAQGILSSKLPQSSFFIDSAGTADYHVGQAPDKRSIAVARNYGIDISAFRGRKFEVADFDKFNIIYVMDSSNYNDILTLARNSKDISKVKFILDKTDQIKPCDVPDPYYGGNEGFEEAYKMLNDASDFIVKNLKNE